MSSPARLSVSLYGDTLACVTARETLSHKASVTFDAARVRATSRELVGVLARGNRQRKLTEACLRDLRALGEELYRLLLPNDTRLDLAETEGQLLLDMDEALVAVPWELLYDGRQFLCRRFEMGRAVATPQARRAAGARKMGAPARMLVLCSDPRGDLPAVSVEGDQILQRLEGHARVTVRLAAAKPVEVVRQTIKDFDIVHYAGHAHYDAEDPERSGWHLSDGTLTARDVAEMTGGRPMPLMVFSNACQSSHEESWKTDEHDQVFGLANAFLLAGTRYYIGTQWEVVDAQSHVFARSFYGELAQGRSVGAAVRRAREAAVVAEGEGGLGWAGYVLYGDPSFVPLPVEEGRRALPDLPTNADILARESFRGILKRGSGPHGVVVVPIGREKSGTQKIAVRGPAAAAPPTSRYWVAGAIALALMALAAVLWRVL